jgi:trans-aconitate methyltransferase
MDTEINTNKTSQFSNSENFDYGGEDINLLEAADNYFKLILENFDGCIGNNILEVGAGTGNLTKWLRIQYPDANITALEPSSNMIKAIKDKNIPNIEIKQGFLKDVYSELHYQFDTIIYNNVLEHVADDQSEINLSYTILKNGGYLLSYNPALQALYDHHDESVGHYRRYQKDDLKTKYQNSGFIVQKAKYHDMLGAFLMFVKYKIFKSTNIEQGSAVLYFDKVLPIVDKMEKYLPVPFGKNLFVIGKK